MTAHTASRGFHRWEKAVLVVASVVAVGVVWTARYMAGGAAHVWAVAEDLGTVANVLLLARFRLRLNQQ